MKSLVIFNPAAGPREARDALKKAINVLKQGNWRVEVVETTESEEAIGLSREAASLNYGAVVAAGGDGTVSEVANGLVGSRTALGVLPLGTGNVWARQIGFTRAHLFLGVPDVLKAAELLLESRIHPVDVGIANRRYFLLWSGIGIDAKVTEEVEARPGVKRRLGPAAFVAAAIVTAITFAGTKATFYLDTIKLRQRVILAIVSNIRLYGALVQVAPYARLDDGLLDVCIFKGYRFPQLLHHVYAVFSGHHVRDPSIEMKQVTSLMVYTAKPMPIHADGEPIGTTPVRFGIRRRALKALIPPTCPSDLFSKW
ncbi:MAG: diacylglycerol kinase family lipid kinase [Chloroflexi bacterium]|nr:MAG: diacylglycerol kinase family lipid kinase [Chloroflexota bacterium]